MNKEALHAHERGAERLKLSPESINQIQKAVDRMWYSGGHKKLTGSQYYSDIRDPKRNLLGYAVYKRIGNLKRKPRLILASILKEDMNPRGTNISNFFHATIKDNNTSLHIPEMYSGLPAIPNNKN